MTTAASVACGIRPISGERNSIVSNRHQRRDDARDLRARAGRPVDRGLRRAAAARHRIRRTRRRRSRAPVANSSTLGRGDGSSLATNARPAAIVSVKLINAMPTAPGHSCSASARSGSVNDGRPARNRTDEFDAVALPREQSPRRRWRPPRRSAAPASAAGSARCAVSTTIVPMPTASVAIDRCDSPSPISPRCAGTFSSRSGCRGSSASGRR